MLTFAKLLLLSSTEKKAKVWSIPGWGGGNIFCWLVARKHCIISCKLDWHIISRYVNLLRLCTIIHQFTINNISNSYGIILWCEQFLILSVMPWHQRQSISDTCEGELTNYRWSLVSWHLSLLGWGVSNNEHCCSVLSVCSRCELWFMLEEQLPRQEVQVSHLLRLWSVCYMLRGRSHHYQAHDWASDAMHPHTCRLWSVFHILQYLFYRVDTKI